MRGAVAGRSRPRPLNNHSIPASAIGAFIRTIDNRDSLFGYFVVILKLYSARTVTLHFCASVELLNVGIDLPPQRAVKVWTVHDPRTFRL